MSYSVPRSGVTDEPGVTCDWCCRPVLDDESFAVMRAGSVSHTNNAEPSCWTAYRRWLLDVLNGESFRSALLLEGEKP